MFTSLEVQLPPAVPLEVIWVVAEGLIDWMPDNVPALGAVVTVTVLVAVPLAHPPVPVTVYVIVAVPGPVEVTVPEPDPTVATLALLVVQVPPETVEVN